MSDPPSVPRLMPQTVGRNGATTSRPRQNNGGRIPNHGVPIGPARRMAPMQARLSAQARNVLGRARNGVGMGEARMSAEVHTGRIHAPPKATRLRARTAPHEDRAPPSGVILMPPDLARNHPATTRDSEKTGKLAKLHARRSAPGPMLGPRQDHLVRPGASGRKTGRHVTTGSIQNGAPTRCAGLIAPRPT